MICNWQTASVQSKQPLGIRPSETWRMMPPYMALKCFRFYFRTVVHTTRSPACIQPLTAADQKKAAGIKNKAAAGWAISLDKAIRDPNAVRCHLNTTKNYLHVRQTTKKHIEPCITGNLYDLNAPIEQTPGHGFGRRRLKRLYVKALP